MDLTTLVLDGNQKILTGAVESIMEESRQSLVVAGAVGRSLVPEGEEAQLFMVSASYHKAAHKNKGSEKGLFQYAIALLAAKRANFSEGWSLSLESLKKDYPSISPQVLGYLRSLG